VSDQYSQSSIKDIINELDRESARIIISKELRGRYKKKSTVITGIANNMGDGEIETMTSEIKTKIGTGGTYKEGRIILQGDHRESVKQLLINKGFNENSIEVLWKYEKLLLEPSCQMLELVQVKSKVLKVATFLRCRLGT